MDGDFVGEGFVGDGEDAAEGETEGGVCGVGMVDMDCWAEGWVDGCCGMDFCD